MATEILAKLLETGVLSEEAGAQIKEALDTKLAEAREEIFFVFFYFLFQ